jgi:hypothetical protein
VQPGGTDLVGLCDLAEDRALAEAGELEAGFYDADRAASRVAARGKTTSLAWSPYWLVLEPGTLITSPLGHSSIWSMVSAASSARRREAMKSTSSRARSRGWRPPGCDPRPNRTGGLRVAGHPDEAARQADPLAVSASEFEELRRLRREGGGAAHGPGDPALGSRLFRPGDVPRLLSYDPVVGGPGLRPDPAGPGAATSPSRGNNPSVVQLEKNTEAAGASSKGNADVRGTIQKKGNRWSPRP